MKPSGILSTARHEKSCRKQDVYKRQYLQGVISAQMIRRQPRDNQLKVHDIMKQPDFVVHKQDSLIEIMQKTQTCTFYNAPVLNEEEKLCGLITRSSLVTTFSKQFELEEGEEL